MERAIAITPIRGRVIVSLLLLLITSLAGAGNNRFKSLSVGEGLAHTDVTCLLQDSTGLVWVGTNAGVQSYNGSTFSTYDYYGADQKIYLSHNRINAIACSANLLWVGTESGLTCIDIRSRQYVPYTLTGNDHTLQQVRITQVYADAAARRLWLLAGNRLYVAQVEEQSRTLELLPWEAPKESQHGGKNSLQAGVMWSLEGDMLKQLSVEQGKVKAVRYPYAPHLHIPADRVIRRLAATSHHLYLRSSQGCYRVPITSPQGVPHFEEMDYFAFHATHPLIPEQTDGPFLVDERTGDLWCSSYAGLFQISRPFTNASTLTDYFRNTEDASLSKITITSLMIDRADNLWVGMNSWGLHCKSLHPLPFYHIPNEKFREKGYRRSEFVAVAKRLPHEVWMVVESGSLFCYNEQTEELRLVPLNVHQGIPYSFQSLYLSNNQEYLYIGMSGGLIRYRIADGAVAWLMGTPTSAVPRKESLTQMCEDSLGRLWVGTWNSGLYCLQDPEHSPSVAYHLTDKTAPFLTHYQVTDLSYQAPFLLVATTDGLNKVLLNKDNEVTSVVTCRANDRLAASMSANHVAAVDIENDSVYWLGTIGGGLNRLLLHANETDNYTATVYTKQHGLAGNDVEMVYHDSLGYVWMGGSGISRLALHSGKMSTYTAADGLQSGSFKMGVDCRAADGTLYMGGPEGLNYFKPEEFSLVVDTAHALPKPAPVEVGRSLWQLFLSLLRYALPLGVIAGLIVYRYRKRVGRKSESAPSIPVQENPYTPSPSPADGAATTRQTLLDEEKNAFRLRLHQLVMDNLSNPDLTVDFFCQQLYMGKTKLWQQVKECCGESLAEYVRNIRLDRAAELLRESTLNITEIKYEVGYTNSSHFARAFKQKFGVSPTDYMKQLSSDEQEQEAPT